MSKQGPSSPKEMWAHSKSAFPVNRLGRVARFRGRGIHHARKSQEGASGGMGRRLCDDRVAVDET